ncbi:hypothetical protein CK203_092143 [Vitis vinifera]|uniref:Uncharacterized protein n=1 Tax=Vitis vinifera TaxID=29760 RepID=A0A438DG15_VITVI|nr:hypothetical protein CK203_092143 [Vitis vinifera]
MWSGVPFADFGSLVMALYNVEDDISRGLWADSSPSDVKGKKPFVGQRSTDVSAISSSSQRPPRRHQPVPQLLETHPSCTPQQFRPQAPCPAFDQTYQAQPWLYLTMPLRALRDLCFIHSHWTAMLRCTVHSEARAFIPQAPSSTGLYSFCFEDAETVFTDRHAVEPGSSEAHKAGLLTALTPRPPPQPLPPHYRMDLHCAYHQGQDMRTDRCTALRHAIQDLIDQGLVHLGQPSVTQTHYQPIPCMQFLHQTEHVFGPRVPTPFRLFPEATSVHASIVEPPTSMRYSVQTSFVLVPNVEEFQAPHSDDPQLRTFSISGGGRVLRQPPPAAATRPLGVRHPRRSLLASSSTQRDALTRALSQIRVDTTTTPEGLIHMMMAGRATCIVFSDDDLPPEGSDHMRHLYISVGFSGRRVPSVLLDNGLALNICPLATAIALGYAPSNFGPSTQIVQAYDNTRREVMCTLEIELLIAGAIPSSLHQKVKFIHEGQVVAVQSVGDMFIFAEPVLQISHSDDDLLLTGMASTVVLDMMRDMSYLPGMGLGRRQHGPSEFITIPDHDIPFRLGFIPTEADYLYMARLRKERVRTRLTHTPFYYPVRPYTRSLVDYFVKALKSHASSDGIIRGLSTTQEAELQRLIQ